LSESTASASAAPDAHVEASRTRRRALATRWLGIGLATFISIVTLGLGFTGRLTLYISPESVWFACAAAVVTLAGAIWSCTLPLGEEADHGHDHGTAHDDAPDAATARNRSLSAVGAVAGGVLATGVVAAALVLPPASLSVELAMSRVGEQSTLSEWATGRACSPRRRTPRRTTAHPSR